LDEQGVYPFKHLIAGGRFVTADARAALEDAEVILFLQDASAKKRGAGANTSSFSSMEISAAPSLANEEFDVHDMRVPTSQHAPQLDKGNFT